MPVPAVPPTVFDYQPDLYVQWAADSSYSFDEGLEVVPLCKEATDPPPHFLIIRRHAPVGFRTSRGQASKNGSPPVVPAPNNTRSGDIFAGGTLTVLDPRSDDQNGTRIFQTDWSYTYVQSGPFGLSRMYASEIPRGSPAGYNLANPARRVAPMLSSGRPPFVRNMQDGDATGLSQMGSSLSGLALSGAIAPILDLALDLAAADPRPPALNNGSYADLGVDYRPNYFSEGLIR
jgi:hypothetical protein